MPTENHIEVDLHVHMYRLTKQNYKATWYVGKKHCKTHEEYFVENINHISTHWHFYTLHTASIHSWVHSKNTKKWGNHYLPLSFDKNVQTHEKFGTYM